MLKALLRLVKPRICTDDQLWEHLQWCHQHLVENREFFIKLIDSMPRRLQQVIENDGGHTQY